MKSVAYIILALFILSIGANGQQLRNATVYSYLKDGKRHYSSKPPPSGTTEHRVINYSYLETTGEANGKNSMNGAWREKSGHAKYIFKSGYDFEYSNYNIAEQGVWSIAPKICKAGDSDGNLYIQAGTTRCCHKAYFLGNNLVLSAVASYSGGVCSDRVLIRDTAQPEG